jgi:hypothetical protein
MKGHPVPGFYAEFPAAFRRTTGSGPGGISGGTVGGTFGGNSQNNPEDNSEKTPAKGIVAVLVSFGVYTRRQERAVLFDLLMSRADRAPTQAHSRVPAPTFHCDRFECAESFNK